MKMKNNLKERTLYVILIFLFLCHLFHPFTAGHAHAIQQVQKGPPESRRGLPSALLERGIVLDFAYTSDFFSNRAGGLERRSVHLGVFDFMLTLNLEQFLRWKGAVLSADLVRMYGKNPSDYVGDCQGVCNIAAFNNWKFYEAWIQQNLWKNKLSFLLGIYDLNSEFDVIETAGLFVNGSHGMGPEFSQSGKNGAPTYPFPALGIRAKIKLMDAMTLRTAILDGVPGDPDNPTNTIYRVRKDDGVLITSEIAIITGEEKLEYFPPISKRKQRRRHRAGFDFFRQLFRKYGLSKRNAVVQTIEVPVPNYTKIAFGGWYYTSDFDDIVERNISGNPVQRVGSWGTYALGEKVLWSDKDNPAKALRGFFRVGIADRHVNSIDGYTGSGLVYSGISQKHHHDQLGFAVAAAHLSRSFSRAGSSTGIVYDTWEIALECTYRIQINRWFFMQPDVQYIVNPGFVPSRNDAWVVGLRIEIAN